MSTNVLHPGQFPKYQLPADVHSALKSLGERGGDYRMSDAEANRQFELRQQQARTRAYGSAR